MPMKDPLVRFGVALESSLLRDLDVVVRERGGTRSELFRDLARATVGKAKVRKAVDAIATLTLVYDHHVRDLTERLTALQHELGEQVRATLHVHINHDLCLEVIVIRGRSDRLQSIADRILALRGVKQGGIEIVAGIAGGAPHGASGEDGEDGEQGEDGEDGEAVVHGHAADEHPARTRRARPARAQRAHSRRGQGLAD